MFVWQNEMGKIVDRILLITEVVAVYDAFEIKNKI